MSDDGFKPVGPIQEVVNLEELLTEPAEVTRWGVALASIVLALIAVLLEAAF